VNKFLCCNETIKIGQASSDIPGCKSKYKCCNGIVDSIGCCYQCCKQQIGKSQGCKQKCQFCNEPWGTKPGCILNGKHFLDMST